MRLKHIIHVAAVVGGTALWGAGPVAAADSTLPEHLVQTPWGASEIRLLSVQSGSRSYMEGRDFKSYQRDQGFAGQRNFGSYPSARGSGRENRPYRLERRRIQGPSDNRCAGWSRRCNRQTGDAPGDYESCMRYHGCR